MAKNTSSRIARIVAVLLVGFFLGTQWDSDPVGRKRHEGVVARTNTHTRNGFIGLGIGIFLLLGVDYARNTVSSRTPKDDDPNRGRR